MTADLHGMVYVHVHACMVGILRELTAICIAIEVYDLKYNFEVCSVVLEDCTNP